ncbi:hypothetical protein AcV5_005478 [Taiwanofungus camphoratus]|nr:hypothetical protein AcV5_005478 [Antrodia cinnamomea]
MSDLQTVLANQEHRGLLGGFSGCRCRTERAHSDPWSCRGFPDRWTRARALSDRGNCAPVPASRLFGLAQRGKAGAETVRRGVVASVPRRALWDGSRMGACQVTGCTWSSGGPSTAVFERTVRTHWRRAVPYMPVDENRRTYPASIDGDLDEPTILSVHPEPANHGLSVARHASSMTNPPVPL